ncbi:VOC family protein [Chamaesiphon minutus]|uniref:Glyoxalase-like domain-containing protein n=1 Tax=Chamaesiphon minutus (strain ATCC 27169 / PCC 6605) TaxID=1173020 RepID=K9UMN5_CHAP6|nr:VOC family protein [Chamaesiphon minutus]AFY96352.1 hypothetical protein Cha6605_5469 [Chamaesiphon minutus PCC 6605]
MTCEFDHLFICTDLGASVAARLVALGLVEGSANTHPGQGTANRRFFFDNAMLELLWVDNEAAAYSPPIARTRLWERWLNRTNGACPFGICLRPVPSEEGSVAFSSWAYHPPYLPTTVAIAVGTNSENLTEPMLFQISFGQRPDGYIAQKAQPLNHPLGIREITRVELVTPYADRLSPELQTLVETDRIELRSGTEYIIELGFDGEGKGQQLDLRSELPLILSW